MEAHEVEKEQKAEKVEQKPKQARPVSVTHIQLYRDKDSVRYVALDSRARRVLAETEDERFPTVTVAKRVLHERHPLAQIR